MSVTMRTTMTGNVQWKFDNGLTVSIGVGKGHYCENKEGGIISTFEPENTEFTPTMEVAVFEQETGDWLTKQVWKELYGIELNDDVVGYVDVGELSIILDFVSTGEDLG
jgi:hypothetical protein